MNSDKYINIYAHSKFETTGNTLVDSVNIILNRKLAGRIKVLQNDVKARKELNIVLVEVKTNIGGIPRNDITGSFTSIDKLNMYNACYQALVLPKFEENYSDGLSIILDLSTNSDFQIGGKFIHPTARGTNDTLWEDAIGMFSEIQNLFFNDRDSSGSLKNVTYNTGYFTAFAMNVPTYDRTPGQVARVGVKNLILFNTNRYDTTMAHEGLHGLGLYHTHKDSTGILTESNRKFTYDRRKTDNFLSYNTGNRKTIWLWQDKIIRKNI